MLRGCCASIACRTRVPLARTLWGAEQPHVHGTSRRLASSSSRISPPDEQEPASSKKRSPNPYNIFVKQHAPRMRHEQPGLHWKERMLKIRELWAAKKSAVGDSSSSKSYGKQTLQKAPGGASSSSHRQTLSFGYAQSFEAKKVIYLYIHTQTHISTCGMHTMHIPCTHTNTHTHTPTHGCYAPPPSSQLGAKWCTREKVWWVPGV
jgi:hypothetical protein